MSGRPGFLARSSRPATTADRARRTGLSWCTSATSVRLGVRLSTAHTRRQALPPYGARAPGPGRTRYPLGPVEARCRHSPAGCLRLGRYVRRVCAALGLVRGDERWGPCFVSARPPGAQSSQIPYERVQGKEDEHSSGRQPQSRGPGPVLVDSNAEQQHADKQAAGRDQSTDAVNHIGIVEDNPRYR